MGAFAAGSGTSGEVADYCRSRLPADKRPRDIRRVDSLPRTVTGLIRRGALRRLLAEEAM